MQKEPAAPCLAAYMYLLVEHKKTRYDPQRLTEDQRAAKNPNQSPHLL